MKKLTIFDVYVKMTSQDQCDRMKQVCVDNNLDYWKHKWGFNYIKNGTNYFESNRGTEFAVYDDIVENKTEVTEEQFMELLKEYKKQL